MQRLFIRLIVLKGAQTYTKPHQTTDFIICSNQYIWHFLFLRKMSGSFSYQPTDDHMRQSVPSFSIKKREREREIGGSRKCSVHHRQTTKLYILNIVYCTIGATIATRLHHMPTHTLPLSSELMGANRLFYTDSGSALHVLFWSTPRLRAQKCASRSAHVAYDPHRKRGWYCFLHSDAWHGSFSSSQCLWDWWSQNGNLATNGPQLSGTRSVS